MFIMTTNTMLFNSLTSLTKVSLGIFFMFKEFDKDMEKKTPHGSFSYICVSRA